MNNEAVGGIITNLQEAIESDSSSSKDGSMPCLQDRAREESSSKGDINLFGEVTYMTMVSHVDIRQ